MRVLIAAAAFAMAMSNVPGSIAAETADIGKGLLPHRAIYDISLGDSASSANVSAVSGRLVFEVTGAPCEGFTVNSRFVTKVDDQEGGRRVTDLRSSTHESGNAKDFQFFSRTFAGQKLQEEAKGSASRTNGGISVDLSQPEVATFPLKGDVLFPTQHLIRLIEAAEAGQRIVQADLYDGSEDGRKLYTTTAVIGAASDEPVGTTDNPEIAEAVGTTRHWPVSLSYFDLSKGESGELTPVYTLQFQLYENGVSRALVLDYGNFSLLGELVELDQLPKSTCK